MQEMPDVTERALTEGNAVCLSRNTTAATAWASLDDPNQIQCRCAFWCLLLATQGTVHRLALRGQRWSSCFLLDLQLSFVQHLMHIWHTFQGPGVVLYSKFWTMTSGPKSADKKDRTTRLLCDSQQP